MSNAGTTQAGTRSYADGPYRGTPGRGPATEDVEPRPGRAAARRRRAARRPDALGKLLPRALVVACLAGGSTAYLAGGKAVQLSVDGESRTLHTFAGDVDELLQRQGIQVGDHDIVAPGPDAALQDGDTVAVRFGRPIALTLDGRPRRIWTTAGTVDGALRQLGVRADGAYLSASRGEAIGRRGLELDVRTERQVTFLVDGRERPVRTNAATVGEALRDAGIALHGLDATSVDPDSFPRDGQTISVMRIRGHDEVHEEPVPFPVERTDDPSLFEGTTAVDSKGRNGLRRVTYAYRTVDGIRKKPRRVAEKLLREPVRQVERVGTKPLPNSVKGADHLNWKALAQCEAGGRPNAVDASGTYGGLYQFDRRTWRNLGGHGRPQDASAKEQTFRAKRLYIQRGASPWPVCGRKLYS
ncbi:ubiquitin-like domain-containing protein [Streptomyces sp. NPDC026673]|uniref:ubiquitin-like domain-containing protein n=1 Tax=Streptomyces sp. NPDC026673 TaxID=3155724 RepID=UPI0033C30F79